MKPLNALAQEWDGNTESHHFELMVAQSTKYCEGVLGKMGCWTGGRADFESVISKAVYDAVSAYKKTRGCKITALLATMMKRRMADNARAELGRHGQKIVPSSLEELNKDTRQNIYNTLTYNDPEPKSHFRETYNLVLLAIPNRQWRTVAALYGTGYTMREISVQFGCSESRICQIMRDIKAFLKDKLGEEFWREDAETNTGTSISQLVSLSGVDNSHAGMAGTGDLPPVGTNL